MQIIDNLDFQLHETAVCIGKFDGIHKGHRLLVEEVKKGNLIPVMFTFAMSGGKNIYSQKEKHHLAEELGIEVVVEIPFDERFMHQSPQQFVTEVLVKRCGAKKVVVGTDFRFGHARKGDAKLLQEMGKQYGFETVIMEKLVEDGEVVSSTKIRERIRQGKIEEANALLGTPYRITGKVEKGNQIGRTIATPTANIVPDSVKELPPYGVYAVIVSVEGKQYGGISNLGVKPTISANNAVGLETWLFDASLNLYDKQITVFLIAFQRPEQKFASIESLQEQIKEDTVQAKELLKKALC